MTHVLVDRWDHTQAIQMPPCFISSREGSAHKEASIVEIGPGANANIEPRHIIRTDKVGGLIGRALLVLCTTKLPHRS
jgi:hypothetical protein